MTQQQGDSTGLQDAGANAIEDMGAALPFQHNTVDAIAVKNMRQQQTGGAAANNRNLGARSRGHDLSKGPIVGIGKPIWPTRACGIRTGLHRRLDAAI